MLQTKPNSWNCTGFACNGMTTHNYPYHFSYWCGRKSKHIIIYIIVNVNMNKNTQQSLITVQWFYKYGMPSKQKYGIGLFNRIVKQCEFLLQIEQQLFSAWEFLNMLLWKRGYKIWNFDFQIKNCWLSLYIPLIHTPKKGKNILVLCLWVLIFKNNFFLFKHFFDTLSKYTSMFFFCTWCMDQCIMDVNPIFDETGITLYFFLLSHFIFWHKNISTSNA